MIDYRYLYLLQRHRDGSVTKVLAFRVLFAYRKEQRLHDLFSCSRFTWTNRVAYRAYFQDHYKIGIATNMKSRLKTINQDKSSGKTEWFALTWLEVVFVMGWIVWYKIRPYFLAFVALVLLLSFAACYAIEKNIF